MVAVRVCGSRSGRKKGRHFYVILIDRQWFAEWKKQTIYKQFSFWNRPLWTKQVDWHVSSDYISDDMRLHKALFVFHRTFIIPFNASFMEWTSRHKTVWAQRHAKRGARLTHRTPESSEYDPRVWFRSGFVGGKAITDQAIASDQKTVFAYRS